DQQIAALFGRALLLRSVPEVDKTLDARFQTHAQPDTWRVRESTIAARARITERIVGSPKGLRYERLARDFSRSAGLQACPFDLRTRAATPVDKLLMSQRLERL